MVVVRGKVLLGDLCRFVGQGFERARLESIDLDGHGSTSGFDGDAGGPARAYTPVGSAGYPRCVSLPVDIDGVLGGVFHRVRAAHAALGAFRHELGLLEFDWG